MIPDCILPPGRTNDGVVAARSNHPGGVNAEFMDGSVRFVRNPVSRRVWRALGTRASGEVVSNDDY